MQSALGWLDFNICVNAKYFYRIEVIMTHRDKVLILFLNMKIILKVTHYFLGVNGGWFYFSCNIMHYSIVIHTMYCVYVEVSVSCVIFVCIWQKKNWAMHKLECHAMCTFGEKWCPSETVRLVARIIARLVRYKQDFLYSFYRYRINEFLMCILLM